MAMIKEKLKGHKPIIAAAPERGNVVNLMDALKAEPRRRPSRRPRARARPSAAAAEKPAAAAAKPAPARPRPRGKA